MASSEQVQQVVPLAKSPLTTSSRPRISRSYSLVEGNSWGSIDGNDNGNGTGNNITSNEPESYPFRNFWSIGGSIDEVLFALPSKQEADALVDAFFKYIDPSYPIISEALFRSRFEEFWALALCEKYVQPFNDGATPTHGRFT
jgi:hypothetical protein